MAFDKFPHMRLLHKLEYFGIIGSTHKWINSWLSGCTQQGVLAGIQINQIEKVQRIAAGDGKTRVVLAKCLTSLRL